MTAQTSRSIFSILVSAWLLASCVTPSQNLVSSATCYDAYFSSSHAEKTITACETARKNQSATISQVTNANLNLGRAFVEQASFGEAIEPLNRVLVLDDVRSDARLELAKAYNGLGRYGQAISETDRVPQSSTLHLAALFERAQAYANRKSLSDLHHAVEDLSVVREGASVNPKKYQSLGEQARLQLVKLGVELGEAELRLGTPDGTQRAMDAFEAAYKADPTKTGTLASIAKSALQMARFTATDTERDTLLRKAHKSYADVARITNSASAHNGAAQALQQLGRDRESITHFEKAAAVQNSERAHLDTADARARLADQQMRDGQSSAARNTLTQALGTYEKALGLNPNNAQTYFKMASARLTLGQREQARAHMEAAKALNPNLPGAYLELGKLYFDMTQPNYAQADENFRKVLTMASARTRPGMRAEAAYYRSRIALEGPSLNAAAAAKAADIAVAHDGSNFNYRRQACLARIFNGDIWSEEAVFNCETGERLPTPEALQLEGMFFLRRAHYSKGGDKKRRLEDAYNAFSKGLKSLSAGGSRGNPHLSSRLTVGQGIAQYCVGFAQVGQDIINSTGSLRDPAHAYYDKYHVAKCVSD